MTTLHDRLTALADDALLPTHPVPSGSELWDRGRRLHRLRRTGTAVVVGVCCVLLAGLGWLDWRITATPIDPASGAPEVGIPDRFHKPSKWLPGTDGRPFGPLIATMSAERGSWFGSDWAVVGLSATTGEYRFLDLPEDIRGDEPPELSLSPGGRYVAYWYAAPSTIVDAWDTEPADGYAVYDVTLGEIVLRERLDTPLGVFGDSIHWAGDHSVVVAPREILELSDKGSTSMALPVRVHDVRDGSAREFPARNTDAAGGDWLLFNNGRLRPADGSEQSARIAGPRLGTPAINRAGTRVAALRRPGTVDGSFSTGDPSHLVVADIETAESSTQLFRIPGDASYDEVIGWRDDTTAVVTRAETGALESTVHDEWIQEHGVGVFAVDVATGEESRLTMVPPGTRFATGLLDAPVVVRPAPPQPWSPWAKLWTVVAIMAVGGGSLLIWGRRVRP